MTDNATDKELDLRIKEIMDHPSYRLAYLDDDFLQCEEARPVRLELELLKPEMVLDKAGIKSTVVVFGGTQVIPGDEAQVPAGSGPGSHRKGP